MELHTLPSGPLSTNAYLIVDKARKEAILVDAPPGVSKQVLPLLRSDELRLLALFLTHGHWDHIAEAEVLRVATNTFIYAHEADRVFYKQPSVMSSSMPPGLHIEAPKINYWVKHKDHLALMGTEFEVRCVPGHAPGNVLFYHKDLGAFVGDALFKGSVGRTDLPGGDFETLTTSIQKQIYTLPEDTIIYPGHGEPTTVEAEAATNPYVRKP